MSDKDKLIPSEAGYGSSRSVTRDTTVKPAWYFGTGFLIFWMLLFFAIVLPLFNRLPTALDIEEAKNGEFVGERAYQILNNLVNIGPKVVGNRANEVEARDFLIDEIAKIEKDMLSDYFTMEVSIQHPSGELRYSNMLTVYQGVQNVVVKLASKNSTSESYLLVNSHFDSQPTSPAAGDAGFMVATMLEILRILATTPEQFEHPIVFLFNGAEESALQASHGFITQHKWAANCKAVINLDAAGSGGRDALFQSGPSHPWLVDYYHKSAKHPFATTLGEEVFQTGLIPSDTDFSVFKQYNIPGLDIAQVINGYIYHTKYDRIEVIPRGSIQNTGDNVLSLVRALSNAHELYNTEAYNEGHAVFFDFLGLFFVSYSEKTGTILNYGIAVGIFLLTFISIWRMSAVSLLSVGPIVQRLIILIILQIIALALGLGLPILVAYYFDTLGLSLSYYSNYSLLIGLYVCPSLIGLSLPIMLYYQMNQNSQLPFIYHIQLGLHSWATILTILDIGLNSMGIRSAYIITIPLGFYAVALSVNLLTTFHDRGNSWAGMVMLGQLMPFLYGSNLFYLFIVVLAPMNGRSGSSSNPDLFISGLAAIGTILSFGFLIPMINMFRRPFAVVLSLVVVSAITMYLASSTQLGFPYRARTSAHRVSYQHVRRIFYEYDGTLALDESGYLFSLQDRREAEPMEGVRLTGGYYMESDCEKHMMCGVPLYDERWVDNRLQGIWVHRGNTVHPPSETKLILLNKTVLENNRTIRYEFELSGPDHMSLFIQPYAEDFATISNWTFSREYLENPPDSSLAYHIYFIYGIITEPLSFFIDIAKPNGDFNVPLFQMGVSGHYIGDKGDELSQKFANSFPSYAALVEWPSVYYRYIF